MSKKPSQKQRQIVRQTTAVWQGPLPPPVHLDQYEAVSPGAAALILNQWKDESDHRRKIENEVIALRKREIELEERDIAASHRYDIFSLILSFILIGSFVAAAVYLLINGMATGALVSLATALALFWKGRSSRNGHKKQ